MNVISEATFVLNLDAASLNTYQTWVTVRLMSDGSLQRKSNEGGNGQTWEVFGYVSNGEHLLFTTTATEEQQAKILAHCCYKAKRKCNVRSYGAAWKNATWVRPTVNPATGRKLTAAPSIRDGKPPRDKNVKQRRWNGSLDEMIAKRKRAKCTFVARITIEPETLRITG